MSSQSIAYNYQRIKNKTWFKSICTTFGLQLASWIENQPFYTREAMPKTI